MGFVNWGLCVCLVVVLTVPFCTGVTDPRDVAALNILYISMEFPPLLGWLPLGGDPCGDEWQGVNCVFSNVTSLTLNGLNLGGFLGDNLGFASILVIDLSNNHIRGSIPHNLPITIRTFSLSGNQFTGSIPGNLSTLTQLSDLSLSNNNLSGEIPDAFQQLTGLINLDLSGNNLSSQLPPSMGSLSSLKTLNLHNNKLTGTLDVLQDLSLTNLNIENNLFSGPIPQKLFNIPNFRKDGNPFNTTIIPSPPAFPPLAASPSPVEAPPADPPSKQADHQPSPPDTTKSAREKKFWTPKTVIWVAVIGIVILILVIALGMCLLILRCCKGRKVNKNAERHDNGAYKSSNEKLNYNVSSLQSNYQVEKVPKEAVLKSFDEFKVDNRKTGSRLMLQDEQAINVKRMAATSLPKKEHAIDMTGVGVNFSPLQPPPTQLPFLPVEKVVVNPILPAERTTRSHRSTSSNSSCSVTVFTIASLQQYTNSFSEDNFIGEGMLGRVYMAELPDGKLLAVKKLDATVTGQQSDAEFIELVSSISKLKHANIVELVGYCNERGQRLLVYEYCRNGTLHDALHIDDEIHQKLSWHARIRVALGAARSLQYLHEVCQPLVVHMNFKSANVLLDDKLAVHVSDCGLAPLVSSDSPNQSSGYGAPEVELGSYTCQSDVYSLGVVMLELLTGRKSYDRSRPRGEQSLVRWAIPQLHDIDALSGMVDPSLNGAYPVKSLSRFADIIFRCVQWEPGFRPPISEVVQDILHMI